MTTRSRPSRFARYRWASARPRSSAGVGSGSTGGAGRPDADGDRQGAGQVAPGIGRHGPAHVVQPARRLRRRAPDQDEEELLAAHPGDEGARAAVAAAGGVGVLQQLGDGAQDVVAHLVRAGVVHELEVVEVQEGDGHLRPVRGAPQQAGELLVDVAAVVEPGQRVAQRQLAVAAALPARLRRLVHRLQRPRPGVALRRLELHELVDVALVLLEGGLEVPARGVQLGLLPAGAYPDRGQAVLVAAPDALVQALLGAGDVAAPAPDLGEGEQEVRAGVAVQGRRERLRAEAGQHRRLGVRQPVEPHQRAGDRVEPADVQGDAVGGGRRLQLHAEVQGGLEVAPEGLGVGPVVQHHQLAVDVAEFLGDELDLRRTAPGPPRPR